MNMKSILVLSVCFVASSGYAGSSNRNMFIPLVQCKVSAETVAKVKEKKSDIAKVISLMVDFEDLMLQDQTESKSIDSILAMSNSVDGAVSEDRKNTSGVGSVLTGSTVIDKATKQVTFTSNLVKYSQGHVWKTVLTLTLNGEKNVQGKLVTINTEGPSEQKEDADIYECSGPSLD